LDPPTGLELAAARIHPPAWETRMQFLASWPVSMASGRFFGRVAGRTGTPAADFAQPVGLRQPLRRLS